MILKPLTLLWALPQDRKEWLFRSYEKCGVHQRTNGIQIGEHRSAELLMTRDKSPARSALLSFNVEAASRPTPHDSGTYSAAHFSRTSARPQPESISLSCKEETMGARTRNRGAKVKNANHSRPPFGPTRTKFALFSIA